MSDAQTRPAASRGRVSARGGRGGYSSRGGRGGSRSTKTDSFDNVEDEGEIGQMKKKYADTLPMLKELFSDWSDEDLVFLLEDTDGDLETAVERITEGNVSQWGEVKKKPTTTDRNRSKATKEPQTTSTASVSTDSPAAAVRGGRGRARGGDRGGRGGRGGRAGAHTNGTRGAEKPAAPVVAAAPIPSAATAATTSATPATTAGKTTWSAIAEGTAAKTEQTTAPTAAAPAAPAASASAPAPVPAPASEPVDGTPKDATTTTPAAAAPAPAAPKTSAMPEGTKKGWASLFAKPAPPPPQPKPAVAPAPPAAAAVPEPAAPEKKAPEPEPQPAQPSEPTPPAPAPTAPVIPIERAPEPVIPKAAPPQVAEVPGSTPATSTNVTPAKDDLTKTNLEQIPDASHAAPTATVASNVGSVADAPTPSRGTPSSFAANAARQSGGGRAPGFQRRVMEQQEAVVMPGNHAVDRAAVQFGSMGLNGDAAGPGADQVDDTTRGEQAETRAQPPQHSPVAPRASLPPTSTQQQQQQQQQQQPQGMPTEMAAPTVARPAPGLPPVPQVNAADNSFADFARYTDAQKPYDPFTQQVSQPQPQPQEPFANQAPIQPAGSATTTAASDYSPFYAVDQRLPYNYYGAYGQSQDANVAQRAAAGFGGVSGAEVQQPQIPTTTAAAAQPPSRYGHVDAAAAAAPNSGHTTPNPTLPGAAAAQTPTAAQHMPGQTAAAAAAAAHSYGYGYPYYTNPHYATYMSQMNQQHQFGRNRPMYDDARRYDDHYMQHNTQYGYGNQYGPYGKAAGMYGQPHAAAFSYDHASSPAAASFSQAMPGRDSVYGRTGSAQPSEAQQTAAAAAAAAGGANAFGGGMDVFGRTPAGFGQSQPISQQPPVSTEETKSFDTPKAGGPSPSLAQANRPGSATNNVPGQPQAQTGLPPLQAQQQGQQGFGAYPHLNPQYGSLGGLGGHQAANHQAAAGYGGYGGGFANYYGNTGRGWGGNYGH